jgi:hypothetical protein
VERIGLVGTGKQSQDTEQRVIFTSVIVSISIEAGILRW